MTETWLKTESRKYLARILGATILYAAALVLSIRWLQHNPPSPLRYPIAVLPVMPALLFQMQCCIFSG